MTYLEYLFIFKNFPTNGTKRYNGKYDDDIDLRLKIYLLEHNFYLLINARLLTAMTNLIHTKHRMNFVMHNWVCNFSTIKHN